MAGSGKAIPSKEFIDLEQNMLNSDSMVNSTDNDFTNRTSPNGNVKTTTFAGMNKLASDQRDEFEQLASDQRDNIDDLAEAQRENLESTFTAQFSYKRIGNISLYVGNSLPEVDKLNSYQFPDNSGEWYGPIQDQVFPITIPADPSSDNGWALVNALKSDSLSLYTDIVYKDSVGNSPVENMIAGFPVPAKVGDIVETSGYYSDGDGGGAKYLIVPGNSGDGFGSHNIGSNTAKIQGNNDPRAWGAGASGSDITESINAMLSAGQKIYFKSNPGENLDWIVSSDLEVKFSNYSIKFSKSVTLTQTSNNNRTFWSGPDINDVEYVRPRLRGVGASDTASTVNADTNTSNSQAQGILFLGDSGLTVKDPDILYFKNAGIQFNYASNVRITNGVLEGTHPDSDIPDGDTSRQQFCILGYAETYAEEGSSSQSIKEGTATPHGNGNIRIIGQKIGNACLGTVIFPGYTDVLISDQTTYGKFAQHSVYTYPGSNHTIEKFTYTPDYQYVGVKISNNVLANRRAAKTVRIRNGIISNNRAPCISLESFDKFDDGSFSVSRSGSFFEDAIIKDVTIENFDDIGVSWACSRGEIINLNTRDQSNVPSRPVIDVRSGDVEISGGVMKGASRSFIGGAGTLDGAVTLNGVRMEDGARDNASVYVSMASAVTPMEVKEGRWYLVGNLVYNPATDEVFKTAQTGFTDSNLPSGPGDHASGTAIFRYFGLYADLKTRVNLYRNIYDVVKGTMSNQALSLNDPKFQVKVSGDWAASEITKAQIQGQIDMWRDTNLGNTSKVATTTPSYMGVGWGSNIYHADAIPTIGTFEDGDVVIFRNSSSGGYIGAVCTSRGNPGTWKNFGNIEA